MPSTSLEVQTDPRDEPRIPADLAYCFSKLSLWDPLKGSTITHLHHQPECLQQSSESKLPLNIDDYDLEKFMQLYFNAEQSLKPFYQALKKPILRTIHGQSELQQLAVSASGMACHYIYGIHENEYHRNVLGSYIVQMGLQHKELRDEIFCQICCQTYHNHSTSAATRAWLLMTGCLSCFQPSRQFRNYLLKYVSDHGMGAYKQVCQHQILESSDENQQPPRIYPPCELEWKAGENCEQTALKVASANDHSRICEVKPLTRAEEIGRALALRSGVHHNESNGWTVTLRDQNGYYECSGDDYVLDLITECELPPFFPYSHWTNLVVPAQKGSHDSLKDCAHSSHRKRYASSSNQPVDEQMVLSQIQRRPIPSVNRRQTSFERSSDSRPKSQASDHWHREPEHPVRSRHRPVSELPRTPSSQDEAVVNSLSENRLNQRYHKGIPHSAANVEQWLDTVFDPVLDRADSTGASALNIKGLQDEAEELERRLKGGGDPVVDSEAQSLQRQLQAKEKEAEALKRKLQVLRSTSPDSRSRPSSEELNGHLQASSLQAKVQPKTAPRPPQKVLFSESVHAIPDVPDDDPHANVEEPYVGPSAAKDKQIVNQIGPDGKTKVIRVGKIIWPPPKEEEKKEEVQPGRILIQENERKNTLKLRGHVEVSQKIQDKIKQEQEKEHATMRAKEEERMKKERAAQMAALERQQRSVSPPPVAPIDARYDTKVEDKVSINMKSRQVQLEQQLQAIYDKRDVGTLTTDTLKLKSDGPQPATALSYFDKEIQTSSRVSTPEHVADLTSLRHIHTQLYPPKSGGFLTYTGSSYQLFARKEFFRPTEVIESKAAEELLFHQVVHDVYSPTQIRIQREDQEDFKRFLGNLSVQPHNVENCSTTTKKKVIAMAKTLPLYFSRIFAVNGGKNLPTVKYLAVGHNGLFFLGRDTSDQSDQLQIIHKIPLDDINAVAFKQDTMTIASVDGTVDTLHTRKAKEAKDFIEILKEDLNKTEGEGTSVTAVRDHFSPDPGHLNFRAGDTIVLLKPMRELEKGWLYGKHDGERGILPSSCIYPGDQTDEPLVNRVLPTPTERDDLTAAKKKYVLLEFALDFFREDPFSYKTVINPGGPLKSSLQRIQTTRLAPTWKEQVVMVKWTDKPIAASLLRTDDKEFNYLAVVSFRDLMHLMGDVTDDLQPLSFDKFFEVLMICRNHPDLRDEIFCQVMKQTEENLSTNRESNIMGWRILLLLTSWYDVSVNLQPYLTRYLQTNTTKGTQAELALLCRKNLDTTKMFLGRKNVPSEEEVMFVMKGRYNKRLLVLLPGGFRALTQVSTASVVSDILDQLCEQLGINEPLQKDEFVLFYVLEDDQRYCPFSRDEYLLDVTSELEKQKKPFYLLLQRTSWVFPIERDGNEFYIDVMYQQVHSDWKDGFLLVMPDFMLTETAKEDIAMLTALLIKVDEEDGTADRTVTEKDTNTFVPLMAQQAKGMDTRKWTTMVQRSFAGLQGKTPHESKVLFLDLLSNWPLFGSTFFMITKAEGKDFQYKNCLLAINRLGINILDQQTHVIKKMFPYKYISKTQRRKDDRHNLILELEINQPKYNGIIFIESNKVSSIISLITQYARIQKELDVTLYDRM